MVGITVVVAIIIMVATITTTVTITASTIANITTGIIVMSLHQEIGGRN